MKKIIQITIIPILLFFSYGVLSCNPHQLITNKRIVVQFYNAVINQKDFIAASKLLGTQYKQHNPHVADGAKGLKTFIQLLRDHYPQAHSNIKRVFAEGDFVILQVHAIRTPGTRGNVIFDLFKLQHGKIVEHWDAVEAIPAQLANKNGLF